MKRSYFIFDLDDTLVYELDYLKSAYTEIALGLGGDELYSQMYNWYENGIDVFEKLADDFQVSKENLLKKYRMHNPTITLNEGAFEVLNLIKSKGHLLGLITDGRSITQRNKLKALGVENLFDQIIISEEFGTTKPNPENFEVFLHKDILTYYYIGDNVKKDFVTPNLLGWKTVCLLNKGQNIHPQNFDVRVNYLPQYKIKELEELISFIK
jgi:putative hydrolase of the HAD superfamily